MEFVVSLFVVVLLFVFCMVIDNEINKEDARRIERFIQLIRDNKKKA